MNQKNWQLMFDLFAESTTSVMSRRDERTYHLTHKIDVEHLDFLIAMSNDNEKCIFVLQKVSAITYPHSYHLCGCFRNVNTDVDFVPSTVLQGKSIEVVAPPVHIKNLIVNKYLYQPSKTETIQVELQSWDPSEVTSQHTYIHDFISRSTIFEGVHTSSMVNIAQHVMSTVFLHNQKYSQCQVGQIIFDSTMTWHQSVNNDRGIVSCFKDHCRHYRLHRPA